MYHTITLGTLLGQGASGKVFRCNHRETGVEYACKVITKNNDMNDEGYC